MKRSLQCLTACFLLGAAPVAHAADSKAAAAAEQVTKLTRGTTWKQVEAIPINFLTHHPQGMVKIGDTLCIYTHVNRVGRTSMTLKVEAWAQRYLSEVMEKVTDADFIMVALDREGRPTPVPGDS